MPLCSDYGPRDLCLDKLKKWMDVKELVNNRVIQNCAKFINYDGYTDNIIELLLSRFSPVHTKDDKHLIILCLIKLFYEIIMNLSR